MAVVMDKRTKILLAVLALVFLGAVLWFGLGMLPAESPAPAPSSPPVPVAAPAPQPAPPAPAVSEQAADALIEQALEATGMNRAVDQINAQMSQGGDSAMAGRQVSPKVLAMVTQTMRESFPPQAFHDGLRQHFREAFNGDHLRALLADVSQPAAQRLIALESAPQPTQATLIAYAQQLQAQPLPPERTALLQRLEAAVGASRQATEIVMVTARAMMEGAGAASGQGMRDMEGRMAQLRASLEPQLLESMLLSLAYTYRQASDADLANYIAVYETPHGKWFTDHVFQALKDQFEAGSKDMGTRVVALAEQARSQAGATPPAIQPETQAPKEVAETMVEQPATRPHKRWHLDARECLAHETNRDIIRCAERYY